MAQPHIVVVDYHKGNLSSVARGLVRAGAEAEVSDDPARIRKADGLVLPGVGSFYDAVTFMHESGEDAAVLDTIAAGAPFLGICLGMQLMFDRGDEGVPAVAAAPTVDGVPAPAADALGTNLAPGTVFEADGTHWVRGLGVFRGSCTRLDGRRLKVPHVGWDQVHLTGRGRACPLLAGFPEGANLYFTHSFAVADDARPEEVAARTHYVRSFPCVAWKGNVYGCQFHPEKSSATGLAILRNFVDIVRAATPRSARARELAFDLMCGAEPASVVPTGLVDALSGLGGAAAAANSASGSASGGAPANPAPAGEGPAPAMPDSSADGTAAGDSSCPASPHDTPASESEAHE